MTSSYTKEQETIVLKVLSYKPHQYYQILSVDKTASDSEIKKSYRRLAVKLHPDKNPHPRASEAFKYLNKAWGVLSDSAKKRIYDQTGTDPDSRFAGYPNESSGDSAAFARTSGFNGFQGGSQFEEDIFNLFFGGGPSARTGPTFAFGNNGFTFQTFGGGEHPFFATNARRQRTRRQAQQPEEEPSIYTTLKQLLPIFLFLLVPIISALFSDSSSSPDYSFTKTRHFNIERKTPNYKIPFYISQDFLDMKKLSTKQLNNFDYKVENLYVQDKRSKCTKEQLLKNEMMEDAQGWFYTDYNKLREAENLPMPNCQALRQLNLI